MSLTATDIVEFAEYTGCSKIAAKKVLIRRDFCDILRSSDCVSDIADTLILILDFEFGGYDR